MELAHREPMRKGDTVKRRVVPTNWRKLALPALALTFFLAGCADSTLPQDALDPEGPVAEKVHNLVTEAAPELALKTWYGMPAYFKDGKVLCYFKAAEKFKTRYAQLGFEDAALLDEGNLWPTVYAITDVTEADAAVISALVRKAVG